MSQNYFLNAKRVKGNVDQTLTLTKLYSPITVFTVYNLQSEQRAPHGWVTQLSVVL